MHVVSEDDRPPLGDVLHRESHGSRIRTAAMWIANRIANYRSWDSGPRVTLDSLEKGGAGLVLSVLYSPFSEIDLKRRYASPPQQQYPKDLFEQLERVEDDLEKIDPRYARHLIVRSSEDLDAAIEGDRIGFVHCVEGGFHLGAETDQVRETVSRLADAGVAYITLAHLFWRRVATNAPAIPYIPDHVYDFFFPQETDDPLSELGSVAVEEMYRRNILIDISHMRADAIDATFQIVERLDAETGAAPTDHPIVATHTGLRLREDGQQYNLSKDTVERIEARGGVIGLIMAQHQLNDGVRRTRTTSFDQSFKVITAHLDKLREWTGSHAYSALGTDLDGFIKPTMGGIETAADLAKLRPALEKHYDAGAAEDILWGNAERVLRTALAKRAASWSAPRAPRPPPARCGPSMPGLALSGGGHRAAFFHIGALARLAELEHLRRIRAISTVSGGSIVGALYYLHVKALLEAKLDEEILDVHYGDAVHSVLRIYREAAARNVRGRALLDYGRDLRLASPKFSRTNRIAELFDAWFYRPIRYDTTTGRFVQAPTGKVVMEDLVIRPFSDGEQLECFDPGSDENADRYAPVPILVINATTLNTGHSFHFKPDGVGETTLQAPDEADVDHNERLESTPYNEIPPERRTHSVGTAVAASSAFPGGLAPLPLGGLYEVDGQPSIVQLTDGGVTDNQGVDALLDLNCDHLIVSDASAQMRDVAKPVVRIPALLARVGSIAGRTSREQRLKRAEAVLQGEDEKLELMHLQSGLPVVTEPVIAPGKKATSVPAKSGATGIDSRAQTALARMRTDLDAFSDIEAASMMCLGYRATGAAYEDLKVPAGWWFETIDERLQDLEDPLLRRLRISSSRFGRPLLLFLTWLTLGGWIRRGIGKLLGALAGLALIAGLVAVGVALKDQDVPGTMLYASIASVVAGTLIYAKADVRWLRSPSRVIFDVLVPFGLAITGVLSLSSVAVLADGALHRAWGSTERGIGRWALRAAWQTFTRLVPALLVMAGVIAAGGALFVLVLDKLLNGPVSLDNLVLFHIAGPILAAGLGAALISGVILLIGNWLADLRRALAVGVGVVLAAIALVGALVAATRLQSALGHRGGLPPTLTAAYLTMAGVALAVALIVSACLAFALRRIAHWRNVEGTILPVGMALVVSVLLALTTVLQDDPVSPEPSSSVSERADLLQLHPSMPDRAQATRYRPELLFDSSESRKPLDVESFLLPAPGSDQPAQQICDPDCHDLTNPQDLQELANADPSNVLHLDASGGTTAQPIYYDRTLHRSKTYLDYWVFYGFNDSPVLPSLTCMSGLAIADATCFDHEGDWEGVTVVLDGKADPEAVVYAMHSGTTLFHWDVLTARWKALSARGIALPDPKAGDGIHPLVFVAHGSHASYPVPCGTEIELSCKQFESDVPDGQRDGAEPWSGNSSCGGCVKRFPLRADGTPASWAAFPGRWGQASCTVGLKLCSRSKGPPSPSFQDRYLKPWRAPNCDGLLPPIPQRPRPCGVKCCRPPTPEASP
jgi:microsomal dipeptidase-like Zn-dependent dipeptidase/predicted acylesterase/phospholipase RssA